MDISITELVTDSVGGRQGVPPRSEVLDIVVTNAVKRRLDRLALSRGWSLSKAAFLAVSVGLLALAEGEVMGLEEFKETLGPVVITERRDRRVVLQVTPKAKRDVLGLAEAIGGDTTKTAFMLIVLGLDVVEQVLAEGGG